MYVNRGFLLNMLIKAKRLFQFLNKHFYIILILHTITKYTNNRFSKSVIWLFKVLIFINIIFAVGYIAYFSFLETSVISGFQIYYDLIKVYIDNFLSLLNDLINLDNEDSMIQHYKDYIKNSSSENVNIKAEIKAEVKEGLKEVINEALDRIHEDEIQNQSNTLKNIVLFSGVCFITYFLFVLPGSGVTPEIMSSYNWFNQSLIDFKLNIINYFSNKPGNPSNPGVGSNPEVSLPSNPQVISPSNSLGQSTITPNTPIASSSNLSPCPVSGVATVDESTQTYLDATTVSKLVETQNILSDVLPNEAQESITQIVNRSIKNVTD
jgi:hypothetical protein